MTIPVGWRTLAFWDSVTWKDLKRRFFDTERLDCFPHQDYIFNALKYTRPEDVRVVIIGQDPYPSKGYAHGLAFSVLPHVKRLPPSLRNVLKEYQDDLGLPQPKTGYLGDWSDRGVLLLNRVLTVEEGKAGSHKGIGWETLTYEIVRTLSERREGIVWMLWGKQAQEVMGAIDDSRHLILTAGHPSPLNNKVSFLGCKHFSAACEYLGESRDFWRLV